MGDFKKKYPTDRFRRKKDLARNYLAKKNSYWLKKYFKADGAGKKSHSTIVCQEKYFFHQIFLGKNFSPKPNHPYPYAPPSPIPSQKSNVRPGLGADGNQTLKCVSQMAFQWWKIGSEKLSTLARADTLNNLSLRLSKSQLFFAYYWHIVCFYIIDNQISLLQ